MKFQQFMKHQRNVRRWVGFPLYSLFPPSPPSLPPFLTSSLPHSLPPSLPPSFPHSFPPSLPPSLLSSLPPSPPSLPPSLLSSLLPLLFPPSSRHDLTLKVPVRHLATSDSRSVFHTPLPFSGEEDEKKGEEASAGRTSRRQFGVRLEK